MITITHIDHMPFMQISAIICMMIYARNAYPDIIEWSFNSSRISVFLHYSMCFNLLIIISHHDHTQSHHHTRLRSTSSSRIVYEQWKMMLINSLLRCMCAKWSYNHGKYVCFHFNRRVALINRFWWSWCRCSWCMQTNIAAAASSIRITSRCSTIV